MGKRSFKFESFLEVALLFVFLSICTNVKFTYGQPGFLSIDCGSTRDKYIDDIGLTWVNDADYIREGLNSDPDRHFNITSTVANHQALGDFRYFPNKRNRHCYELPTNSNISYYLIRAMFYYNASESEQLQPPITFNVFINSALWFTASYIRYDFAAMRDSEVPRVHEGIFYSSGSSSPIYFCLQPLEGVPFISSLELRPLDPEGIMYTYPGKKNRFLSTVRRRNFGFRQELPVRYPDDAYDRLWDNEDAVDPRSDDIYGDPKIISTQPQPDANKTSADVNNVPVKVMLDATRKADTFQDKIEIYEDLNYQKDAVHPTDVVYIALYFQQLNASVLGEQRLTMTIPNYELNATQDFIVTTNASMQVFSNIFMEYIKQTSYGLFIEFNRYVYINALEVYTENTFDYATTATFDVELVEALKNNSNLQDWQGDPCFPVPYDWLTCYEDTNGRWAIYSMNLSYNAINIVPQVDYWWGTNIKSLDLSHNSLEGGLSSFVNNKPFRTNLQKLDISNDNFNGTFPSELFFLNFTSLEIATFDRNDFQGTLDLNPWLKLLEKNENDSLFSFIDNSISDIKPSAEDLKSIIEKRLLHPDPSFNKTGILLGGNPYCKDAKSITQRYLCRYTVEEIIFQEETNSNTFLIIGIIGGVFALLICCISLATTWKLWKQVYALRQMQQALANQKVQPPFYSYNDLKSATKDFHKENKLGKGAFGVVYKGVLVDGTTLAVKKLLNSQQVQVLNEFFNEVVLITGIKHRNLVQLKGCCINNKERILVYEHVENGNVAEALWDKKTSQTSILDWQQRFNICLGVARGLSYLHEELQPRIIHRDIKPANILLDKNFNPKIADFGLARHFLDEQSQANFTHVAGTRGYFAPEYAAEGKLTNKADVYSFGILVLEIISGRKVIDYNMPPEKVYLKDWVQNLQKKGMLLDVLQPELRTNCVEAEVVRVINIALICVQMDPEKRKTMSQVIAMLMGTMDVKVPLDSYHQQDFDSLFPTTQSNTLANLNLSNLCNDVIVEESIVSPLLQHKVDIDSRLSLHSNVVSNGNGTLELSNMNGR